MIKKIAKDFLRAFGLQLTRIPKQAVPAQPRAAWSTQPTNKIDFSKALSAQPLDAGLHLRYALHSSASGRPYLAYAELKTAEYLGAERNEIEKHLVAFWEALPEQKSMNHNQYFRFYCLASEIVERGGRPGSSILDVGGGEGQLATFVPELSYCLAEPQVNGISGIRLPFADNSFDYVVSCHVLEHIPVSERETFLLELLSKAKRGLILLNPFHIESTLVEERLKLILEITGAEWAREHLQYTLPKLQDIKDFAVRNNLQLDIKPNGTMTTSLAFVFVNYFSDKAALHEDVKKLNAFVNEKYTDILTSSEYPNAYLIYLSRSGRGDYPS